MSRILGALGLSNLFSSSGGTKKPSSGKKVTLPEDAQPECPKPTEGKEEKAPSPMVKDIQNLFEMEASSYAQSQRKFPGKIFNIDINSLFPPMEDHAGTSQRSSAFSLSIDKTEEEGGVSEPIPSITGETEFEQDPGITEIINSGIREFQADYLQKIDTAFQLQVDNMTTLFSAGLAKAHIAFEEQLNQELAKISNDYTNRLIEFETTTTYYQDAKEDVLGENKKQEEEMAGTIQAFLLQFQEVTEKLETEHQTKLQEAERQLKEKRGKEKLEEHEEILEATNIATTLPWAMEEGYKLEIQDLESRQEKLRLENQELEEKIEYGRIHALAESNRRANIKFMKERDRHEALLTLNSLQKKLETLTKQNTEMCYVHQQRITQMIETQSIRADHYNSEYRYFQSILADARANYKEDLGHFQESARIQEQAHKASMEDLKNSYRSQVMNLVESVYALKRNTDIYCSQTVSSPELTQTEATHEPGMNTTSAITLELSKLQKEVS